MSICLQDYLGKALFSGWFCRDDVDDERAKRETAQFIEATIQAGNSLELKDTESGLTYQLSPELHFTVNCEKPMGAGLKIQRYEYYVPGILGKYEDVQPALGDSNLYPALDAATMQVCQE